MKLGNLKPNIKAIIGNLLAQPAVVKYWLALHVIQVPSDYGRKSSKQEVQKFYELHVRQDSLQGLHDVPTKNEPG